MNPRDIATLMDGMGRAAVEAARVLARASGPQKNRALGAAAQSLRARAADILAANRTDLEQAQAAGLGAAALDRLRLDEARVEGMARGVEDIAALGDPVGRVLAEWRRPIGIIYESRPNVTCDAGALCLKSGNAVILRGGSESLHSSRAIHACLVEGLRAAELTEACIQLVPTTDRAAVGQMLS
jgi:glutamate-5-semialdehyde dehydrogenase